MAEISQEELKELLANQRKLMEQNAAILKENAELREVLKSPEGGSTRILRRVTERKVRLMFVDGRAVIGFANRGSEHKPVYVYEKPDPNNSKEMIAYVDLIREDMKEGEKPLTVPFKQFREEGASAECRVVHTEEKEWVINQGLVRKKEVEEYSSIELDMEVPLDIVGKARFFTVEVPREYGGPRQLTVHENYVNIK